MRPIVRFGAWSNGTGCRGRRRHGQLGIIDGAFGFDPGVLLGGDEVDVTVEREFAFLAQPSRRHGECIDLGSDMAGKSMTVLAQQRTHIMHVGWLDPNLAQHRFQREFDNFLCFADDV